MALRLDADIYLGIAGQSVYFDVPNGQPSAVTSATIYDESVGDDDVSEVATDGSPSFDSVSVLLTAAAGATQLDSRVLEVVPTGVVVGREYLLVGANGQSETVEVIEKSAAAVGLRYPLVGDYESGDALTATRIAQDLDDSWTADEVNLGRYRVRWVYVVDGVTAVRDSYFALARYAGDHEVSPTDVEAASPGWLNALPPGHRADQGRGLIERAYKNVAIELRAVEVMDESLRDPEVLDQLVIRMTIADSLEARVYNGTADPLLLADARERFDSMLGKFVRVSGKLRTDETGTGAGFPVEARRVTVR